MRPFSAPWGESSLRGVSLQAVTSVGCAAGFCEYPELNDRCNILTKAPFVFRPLRIVSPLSATCSVGAVVTVLRRPSFTSRQSSRALTFVPRARHSDQGELDLSTAVLCPET